MTKFSRKKLRGFDRKIKQLESWKTFIVSYPFDKLNSQGKIFRVDLSPFVWYGDQNPNITFHKYFYLTLLDIFKNLKENKTINQNDWTVQLWLFYPRTVRSLIIVAPRNLYKKRNEELNLVKPDSKTPKLFGQLFDNHVLKIGADNVFQSHRPGLKGSDWLTLKHGDIWTVD